MTVLHAITTDAHQYNVFSAIVVTLVIIWAAKGSNAEKAVSWLENVWYKISCHL